jgi:hypothetical protein
MGPAVSSNTKPNVRPDRTFDEYGTLRWEDEKARLDNFAIQITAFEGKALGYVLVVDQTGGCPGEAQARATRAKRYMVEYRGVPWNSVLWRREGYDPDIRTTLLIVPNGANVPYPFLYTLGSRVDGPMTRACKVRLARIRRSRW